MKQGHEWLLEELPELVRAGVLDPAAAERLRAHYQSVAMPARSSWARILTAALGAVLIGLGVILLVAHNWDGWSRSIRVAVAFAPLLVGQLACFWALLRAPQDAGWREGAAAFTVAGFAAALALVGQIYHFPGDLDRYLLTCVLVSLPLVYLLNASVVAVLCAAGMAAWAGASENASPLWVVVLFAALVPHVWRSWRQDAQSLRSVALVSFMVPLFFVAVLVVLPHTWRLGWLWFAECTALLWLLDRRDPGSVLRRPLESYGHVGVAVVALAGSFTEFWAHQDWYGDNDSPAQAWLLLGAGLVLVLLLTVRALRARNGLAAAGAFPALMLWLSLMVDPEPYAVWLALLFNVYVLILGIALIRDGVAVRQMARANSGLVLIAALILMRFFDSDWPFTVRGIAFVLIGIGFLMANQWLKRRVQA